MEIEGGDDVHVVIRDQIQKGSSDMFLKRSRVEGIGDYLYRLFQSEKEYSGWKWIHRQNKSHANKSHERLRVSVQFYLWVEMVG